MEKAKKAEEEVVESREALGKLEKELEEDRFVAKNLASGSERSWNDPGRNSSSVARFAGAHSAWSSGQSSLCG